MLDGAALKHDVPGSIRPGTPTLFPKTDAAYVVQPEAPLLMPSEDRLVKANSRGYIIPNRRNSFDEILADGKRAVEVAAEAEGKPVIIGSLTEHNLAATAISPTSSVPTPRDSTASTHVRRASRVSESGLSGIEQEPDELVADQEAT